MRLRIALALASVATAIQTPRPYITNNTKSQNAFLHENLAVVPQLPEECSLAACLNLTAQLTCITNSIVNGDPVALQKCLTTSLSQICSCVACIPALDNVLIALGVCPVNPSASSSGDQSGSSKQL